MGCVRKRGESWNAQVRVSIWRSFTKSFSKKSDAVIWIKELEHKLHSALLPDVIIDFDMNNASFPLIQFSP